MLATLQDAVFHLLDLIKQIGNASQEGYVLINKEYRIEWLNCALENKGFRLEKVLGTFYSETFNNHKELDDGCPTVIAFKNGQTQEELKRGSDGREYIITSIPIRIGDDIEYVLEISREKTQEVEIKEELMKFKTAVTNSFDAVFLTDKYGNIVYVNRAYEEMTGYTAKEVVGQTPSLFRSPREGPGIYHRFWNTILNGKPWQQRMQKRRKDGTVYCTEVKIIPLKNNVGRINNFLGIEQDITERMMRSKKEEMLRQQVVDLVQEANQDTHSG